MSETIIDVNTVINDIQTLSDKVKEEMLDIDTLLSSVRSNWCGPASNEFQKQLQLLQNELSLTSRKMNSISQALMAEANKQY